MVCFGDCFKQVSFFLLRQLHERFGLARQDDDRFAMGLLSKPQYRFSSTIWSLSRFIWKRFRKLFPSRTKGIDCGDTTASTS